MFNNYLKIAYRNFIRYKLFSFINVFGLAIGIAVCTIISLWVSREISYDQFNVKAGRIYRIERELFRDNSYSRWPITSGAYKQALIDDYPEIENAVRFWRREFSIKDHNNFVHQQSVYAVDNSIFEIFSFGLKEGDELTALQEPMSVVLTRENALKYFGTDDAIGKSLSFELSGSQVDFKVTGILNAVPENSHIHFDMLISISSYPVERFADWRSNYLYTYILTAENTAKDDLEEQLKSFVTQWLKPVYDDLLSQGLDIHEVLKVHLVPVTDIHLNPSLNWEIDTGGSIVSVYIFSSIAVLILFIACINFMNLSTAIAKKRSKEVGLRKTVGAFKRQLIMQFIQESVLLAVIAMGISIILIAQIIPLYNSIFNEKLVFFSLNNLYLFIGLLGITLVIGLFAGLYPAFYLSNFKPIEVLKGSSASGNAKLTFRRNMVVVQFVISVTLIVGTITIYQQMQYIQNQPLGFDKENVVLIPVRSQKVIQGYEKFRNELLGSSRIQSLAVSSDLPGEAFYSNTNFISKDQNDNPVLLIVLATDYDFIDTYKIEVVSGRTYSKEFQSDTIGTIMLNEAAVKRFGWTPKEAIGKELSFSGQENMKVVGVAKDFNFRSLHTEIEPMALLLYPTYFSAISVRLSPGELNRAVDFIQEKWASSFPGELFEFSFLDERMNQLYENEMKMQNIFTIFSFFSIFVACLGLFGLSVFIASERTKEIGIRKVLGASIGKIIILLSKEYITWILLANIIAWPLAYYFMNNWLNDFAYKTDLTLWIFLFAGILSLAIAIVTVSYQSIKAAVANPVDSLRNE